MPKEVIIEEEIIDVRTLDFEKPGVMAEFITKVQKVFWRNRRPRPQDYGHDRDHGHYPRPPEGSTPRGGAY